MLPESLSDAGKYIQGIETELAGAFRQRNLVIDRMRDLYFLRHHKGRKERTGETFVTVNKPTNIVDLTIGILASQPMRIKAYRGTSETEESEEDATKVEKFLRACLYINNERQESDIEISALTDQVRDGWGCVYSYWDPNLEGELPVVLERIDPKEIYYERGGPKGGYRLFARSCQRRVDEIEDEWGVELEDRKTRAQKKDKVKYIDYWGWTRAEAEEEGVWVIENGVLADGQWVKEPEYMWNYKHLPFTIFPGRLTNSDKPELAALSILFPSEHAFKDLEEQLSHHRRLTNLYSAIQLVIETGTGEEPPGVDAVLGKPIYLKTGERAYFPEWHGSPDIDKVISSILDQIQEGSYPQAQYGVGSGASSGFAISLLTESGRIRLQQFQKNLERSWAVVFRKVLSLATEFAPNQNLPVYGEMQGKPFDLDIVGGDMRGFRVDVEIKAQFPQDEARKKTFAMQIKSQGLLSDRTIQEEYLDIDHPDDELDRMLLQAAMNHPELQKAKILEILREYAPEAAAEIEKAEQPAPQQVAPETQQQNVNAQAAMGVPPTMPGPPLPPAAMMPQEIVGIGPPQSVGMPPPGQLNPEILQILQMMGGLPGVR